MGHGKRSGSRKPSNKRQPASRNISPSPSSAPAPVPSHDQQGKLNTETMETEGELPQNAVSTTEDPKANEQAPSSASEVPVITEDGPLNSPQIEPALGVVIEEPVNDIPAEEPQTPGSIDQSLLGNPDNSSAASPTQRRPSFNLATELENESMDGSEEETRTEFGGEDFTRQEDSGTDPGQEKPKDKLDEASRSNEVPSGRTEEDFQQEIKKRLAAEERVQRLEAELKRQQQIHEEAADAAKKKFERALQKADQAREQDKMKFDETVNEKDKEFERTFQETVGNYTNNVTVLTKALENADKAAAENKARAKKEADQRQLQHAYENFVKQPMEIPSGKAPLVHHARDSKPGSARFLLAESEYLLNKSSPLYDALRAAADFADGRADDPSEKEKKLFGDFRIALQEKNEFMINNMGRAQDCLIEVRADWVVAAEVSHW